jgi:hypothetical protein
VIVNRFVFAGTVLLVAWAAMVSGNNLGGPNEPDRSGVNGVTCSTSGCHFDFPVNSGAGNVAISGLPSEWSPGVAYALTVTVSDSNASLYGFQLTAVDSNGAQAGNFTAGDSRSRVMEGSAGGKTLQHIQHTFANPSNTFPVVWTAPATAATGGVRFNTAGNAANGLNNSSGDFIYSTETTVSPVTQTPTDNSLRTYSIVDKGGLSLLTTSDGSPTPLVAYTKIQPDVGSTTPSGVGIFGFRQNNVLVSETGVPAAPLVQSGRIFVVVSDPTLNTGIAIANPNDQAVTIDFVFTDATLEVPDFAEVSLTMEANTQLSRFLTQEPFSLPDGSVVTATFTSPLPIGVVALRGVNTSRNEFLTSAVPVVSLTETSTERVYLPHFAAGGGWNTQVILINPTDDVLTGVIGFIGTGSEIIPATTVPVAVANQFFNSVYPYVIPAKGMNVFQTVEFTTQVKVGSVQVNPTTGETAPAAFAIFGLLNANGEVVSEASVPASGTGSAFRMYAEASGVPLESGSIQSGFAIRNVGFENVTVTLELTDLNGALIDTSTIIVPATGQRAQFVDEIFTAPFQGVLRVSVPPAEKIAVMGLRARTNERNEFLTTTTTPANEAAASTTAQFLFPHLVDGGGWSTQTILFSGIAGQTANGVMRFFGTDGLPFNTTLQ